MSEKIETSEDWEKIGKRGLKVIDPMVFRTADVFLRGRNGWTQYQEARRGGPNPPKGPTEMWTAISSNIGALCAFFDNLILEESLPMFDYDKSFPPDIDMGGRGTRWLVNACNNIEKETIVEVRVQDKAYLPMRDAAITQLTELPPISPELANDILGELSAFDYEWRPDLWPEPPQPGEKKRRVLEAFQYGGLLFSGYAQQMGTDHILQPKRSKLYLEASLGALEEEKLFEKLMEIANEAPEGVQRTEDLPDTPTFLPYLLMLDPKTPYELLNQAVMLRHTEAVKEFRTWRNKMLADIEKGRGFRSERQQELETIGASIIREIRSRSASETENGDERTEDTKIGGKIGYIGPVPQGEISVELSRPWTILFNNWVLKHVPGYRYRKLLMKMVISQRNYTKIDRHLKQIWNVA